MGSPMIWASVAAFLAAIAVVLLSVRSGGPPKHQGPAVPQFQPAGWMSVALAADLLRERRKAMTATLVEFAVRGKIRLLYRGGELPFGMRAVGPRGLSVFDAATYSAIFTGDPGRVAEPGTKLWLDKRDLRLGDAEMSLVPRAIATAEGRGLTKHARGPVAVFAVSLLALSLVFLLVYAFQIQSVLFGVLSLVIGIPVAVVVIVLMVAISQRRASLSEEGYEALKHLEGLRLFMDMPDWDRTKMIQMTVRAGADGDSVQKAYERLLPYAILFGCEKEWISVLEPYYRGRDPKWIESSAPPQQALHHILDSSGLHRAVVQSPSSYMD